MEYNRVSKSILYASIYGKRNKSLSKTLIKLSQNYILISLIYKLYPTLTRYNSKYDIHVDNICSNN